MLLLLPVFLLLLTAISIQVLARTRFNVGQTWVFAIIASTAIWILVSILRIIDPPALIIRYLDPSILDGILLSFNFTTVTWVFGFLLLTLLGAILLADSSRLSGNNNPIAWSGAMVITAAGILVCMSGSFAAFILSSTFLDITLLIVGLIVNRQSGQIQEVVIEFSGRVAGSIILMTTLGNSNLDLVNSQPDVISELLPFFIISLILRMGVIHSNKVSSISQPVRRNLQIFIQMIVPVTVFAFISRLSFPLLQGLFFRLTIFVLFGIVLIKAIKLLSQKIFDPKIWIEILAILGIGSILLEQTKAILPIGIVMISIGGAISITEARSKWTSVILMVLMLGMIGLPYTPSNGIWLEATSMESGFAGLFHNLIIFLALLGVSNNFLKKISMNSSNEKWVDFSNGMSPIILMVSPWIYLPWTNYLSGTIIGMIGAGIVIGISLSRLLLRKWWVKITQNVTNVAEKLKTDFQFFESLGNNFLKLTWLTNIFKALNYMVEWLVTSTIRMLEGEGGLLWALVLLILLTSIIVSIRTTL